MYMAQGTPMLTTTDNPYNPYTNFDEWFLYDTLNGYNSCSLLDRMLDVNDEMSDEEVNAAIEQAIDQIVLADLTDKYIKIYPNTEKEE